MAEKLPGYGLHDRISTLEDAILGSAILDPDVLPEVLVRVKPEMLYNDPAVAVYHVLKKLNDEGAPIETVTVIDTLRSKGYTGSFLMYPINAIEKIGTTANVYYYCDCLIDLYRRRMAIALCNQGQQRLTAEEVTVGELVDQFTQLTEWGGFRSAGLSGQALVERRVAGLLERINTEPVLTGFGELDKCLSYGLGRKMVSVIAGRPSMGKSTLKTAFIKALCESGKGVISFSPEQTVDVEMDRFCSLMTGIPLLNIIRCKYWGEDDPRKDLVNKSMLEVSQDWNFTIAAEARIAIDDIYNSIRRVSREYKVDAIFIDLFDRVKEVNVVKYKPQAVTVALNRMCDMAKELDVHICLLAQIKRFGGKAKGAKNFIPTLESLKDSGAYEEYADLVFLLYREGYYDQNVEDNVMSVIVGKQRNGIAGIKKDLTFDKSTLKLGSGDGSGIAEQGAGGAQVGGKTEDPW